MFEPHPRWRLFHRIHPSLYFQKERKTYAEIADTLLEIELCISHISVEWYWKKFHKSIQVISAYMATSSFFFRSHRNIKDLFFDFVWHEEEKIHNVRSSFINKPIGFKTKEVSLPKDKRWMHSETKWNEGNTISCWPPRTCISWEIKSWNNSQRNN